MGLGGNPEYSHVPAWSDPVSRDDVDILFVILNISILESFCQLKIWKYKWIIIFED